MKHAKIAIIGAGFVGSTTAYALILSNITAEIILVDVNEIRCRGEILDLSDSCAFDSTSKIRLGTSHDVSQADIIIIAAGKPQKPDESRTDLLTANLPIIDAIFAAIKPINKNALIIVVTNPLDLLTLHVQNITGLPRNQIFGTGTFLDTLRLREILAAKINVSAQSVDAYIIGEHGDTQFAAWSAGTIAGNPIIDFPGIQKTDLELIAQEVKNKAYEIISCKGATYYGIASCVARICKAIIFDQKIVLPLSTYNEQFKLCLSMPAVLGENGIETVVPIPLNDEEQKKLDYSASELRKLIQP
jgi:L-lactate dehydrogenase